MNVQAVTQKTSDSDVSSFGGESSSDESLKFDDGLDENLIGDEEDRKRLDQMTEAEREQEMYNRYAHATLVYLNTCFLHQPQGS